MSIASLVLVIYILFIFTRYNKEKVLGKLLFLYFIFSTFIQIGYAFKIKGSYIYYNQFILIILIIFLFWKYGAYIKKIWIKKENDLLMFIVLILFLAINITLLIFRTKNIMVMPDSISDIKPSMLINANFNLETIEKSFMLIIFLLLVIVLKPIIDKKRWRTIITKYMKFGNIILVYCYIELLYLSIIANNDLKIILAKIFGKHDAQFINNFSRQGLVTLQGFSREPSHLAMSMVIFGIVILLFETTDINKTIYLILISVILFLSGSFLGSMGIIILSIIYLILLKNKVKFFPVILLLIIALSIISINNIVVSDIYIYYIERLRNSLGLLNEFKPTLDHNMSLQKVIDLNLTMTGGSEIGRISSIIYNLDLFYQNPLFGVGIGATNAHGMWASILANLGGIGTTLWILILADKLNKKGRKRKYIMIIIVIMFFFMGGLGELYSANIIILLYSINFYNDKNVRKELI